jgi:hypothetical protein
MEWRIRTSRHVLDRWAEASTYSAHALVAYWEWVQVVNRDGPPDDAIQVFSDDDLFLASIPGTNVVVSFLVSVQDRVVIVKEIA